MIKYIKLKEEVDFSLISDVICEYFEVNDKTIIFTKNRKKNIIMYRQWFQYFARLLNPIQIVTYDTIGKYYSDVTSNVYDHATVLYSYNKIKSLIEVYKHEQKIKHDILMMINDRLKKVLNENELKFAYEYHFKEAMKYKQLLSQQTI